MTDKGTAKPIPRDLTREKWEDLLSKISDKVKQAAFDRDLPVTVAQGNLIVRLFKDGRIEEIEQLEEVERKSTGKILKIA